MKYNKKLKRSLEKTPKFSQTMKRFKSNKTVSFLMAAVLKVLRDEHGFGAVRLQKFSMDVLKQLEMQSEGYVTYKDILDMIAEETGFDVREEEADE